MLQEASRREKVDLDLLRRYHDHQDRQARERLAERFVPLVRSIARKYANRGEDLEDLEQAGMIGLVKAIDRFDATAGHRFISFAVPNIQGEIRRHFRDHTWAVHVPRSVQELDAKVQHATRSSHATTGREPSVDELSKTLEVTAEQVRDAQQAGRNYRTMSLDVPSGESRTMTDLQGTTDPGYAEIDVRSVLEQAFAALDPRERQVVSWSFRDQLLQREIAERVGVSQMQVSRILSQAVARMRERVKDEEGGPLAA